jgi:hypothetical protein
LPAFRIATTCLHVPTCLSPCADEKIGENMYLHPVSKRRQNVPESSVFRLAPMPTTDARCYGSRAGRPNLLVLGGPRLPMLAGEPDAFGLEMLVPAAEGGGRPGPRAVAAPPRGGGRYIKHQQPTDRRDCQRGGDREAHPIIGGPVLQRTTSGTPLFGLWVRQGSARSFSPGASESPPGARGR